MQVRPRATAISRRRCEVAPAELNAIALGDPGPRAAANEVRRSGRVPAIDDVEDRDRLMYAGIDSVAKRQTTSPIPA